MRAPDRTSPNDQSIAGEGMGMAIRRNPLIPVRIGTATNGMWPKNCTHQRYVTVGGRPVNEGIRMNDMNIQMHGPYTAATASRPAGVPTTRRSQPNVR